ncbi:Npun_F0813 family protein [Leptolyngbya sp. NIES-2104]|uniref:Npun_F0813 family protein n=1 Tax=Leptolyngbya sp. NIES-2104 TaxID=1552121 RepID=UPI0006ECA77A|nr:Npun_F0813 family protein [Leptolyngbya sp. NIES-2104]GAP95940.1 inosine-uridine nucleoside N-ribohydrolase [Leptolyngbya sp. NIES-2104]
MFILKRQDVEISSIQHPKRDQKVPILSYQGQTFRLIQVFSAGQEEDARSFWRDLTDNQGKACVLLEEPERYSVWGKVRLDQLGIELPAQEGGAVSAVFTQACLLMLQAMYIDIEDLMGTKQATSFERDLANVLQQWRFPQTESPTAIKQLLTVNPLNSLHTPTWQESLLNVLLQELHRLGKAYFGKSAFVDRILDALQDLPQGERSRFLEWLNHSPTGKLWS